MEQYVLSVDHGSGGCKVTCLSSSGAIVSESYVSYPSYYDYPRWVEQDPEIWIEAAIEGIHKVLDKFSHHQRNEVKAISFSAPHHVAVLLDKNLNVLRRVIMWNDQRTGEEVKLLNEKYGSKIIELTNHKATPTWTLPHLLWLKNHEPDIYGKIHKIVFEKDYVRYRFCGELGTDYIEAEGTMLYDVHNQEWSEELLRIVSLDKDMLPKVYKPTDIAGKLHQEMADKLNLPAGIPIVFGTADTAAEVYGSGATRQGDGVVKLATAGNYTVISNERHKNMNLTGYSFPVEGLYYHNSATNFAAASFRWYKETFFSEIEEQLSKKNMYSHIDEEIASRPPGANGLLFHPYLNGERSPHWDPYLTGSFFGVTARHNRADFSRAVLEGVGFSIREASLEFEERAPKRLKFIGGGAKSEVWGQIMADILDAELEIPKTSDASFGGCLIAAKAIGWFDTLEEAANEVQKVVHRITPKKENVLIYDELFSVYQEFHKQTKELSHKMSDIHERIYS